MSDEAANEGSHTIPYAAPERSLIGLIMRICVPALLWTVVDIAIVVVSTLTFCCYGPSLSALR
jgi:hypothetical protein